jgi:exosortase/archaeosortase
MRNIILSFLIIINIFSIFELGTYDDGDFIQLISVRVIIAAISLLLSVTYILVKGTKTVMILSVVTALIALSHFIFLIFVSV